MSYPATLLRFVRIFSTSRWPGTRLTAIAVAWASCVSPAVVLAQNVSVAPLNLVFNSVAVGASSSLPVTITNITAVPQTPNYAGGAPNDPVNFGGSQNCAGVTLAPGASCAFTYVFHPTTIGAKASSTTIDVDATSFPITMSGTGVSGVSVTPLNLVFNNVAVGATASIPVIVTNTSGAPLTPNYAGGAPNDPVNFGGSQNCAGVTLAPGASCAFTYDFHPTTIGAKNSSTTIDVNGESFAITMSGTGVSGVSVAPLNLVFNSVAVGASASIPVIVTNTSGVPLTPNYAGGAPNDPVNFGGSQNCAGVTLPPGGSCAFTYVFHPTTIGAKNSSTTIDVNGESFAITMSGTGVSGVSVAPLNLLFGGVAVGASASIPVIVTNTSGVPLTPNYAGGAPNDPVNFGGSQNCAGVTLPPGGTCMFTYVFHPTIVGPKNSSTTIDVNGESFAITMSGVGSAVSVAPVNLVFNNVPVGASSSMAVTVTNVTGVPQTPTYAGGAPDDPVNFDASQNCAGVTLAPGASCAFTYVFHPTSAGAKSSSTSITIDGTTYVIALAGTGSVASPIPLMPGGWLLILAAALAIMGLFRVGRPGSGPA